MKFPAITFVFYIGLAAADEGATAWAISRHPELRAAERGAWGVMPGLPTRYRIPVRVGIAGAETYIDRKLKRKEKSRLAFRIGAIGIQAAAIAVAVKRGSPPPR